MFSKYALFGYQVHLTKFWNNVIMHVQKKKDYKKDVFQLWKECLYTVKCPVCYLLKMSETYCGLFCHLLGTHIVSQVKVI